MSRRAAPAPVHAGCAVLILSGALAFPVSVSALGLLPKSEGQAAWEALQVRVLGALGGTCAAVTQPAQHVSAVSIPGATRDALPVNKMVATELQPTGGVKFVLGPEQIRGKPQDAGGLLALDAPATGTYVLGTVSTAWIDLVDHDRADPGKPLHGACQPLNGLRVVAGVVTQCRLGVGPRVLFPPVGDKCVRQGIHAARLYRTPTLEAFYLHISLQP